MISIQGRSSERAHAASQTLSSGHCLHPECWSCLTPLTEKVTYCEQQTRPILSYKQFSITAPVIHSHLPPEPAFSSVSQVKDQQLLVTRASRRLSATSFHMDSPAGLFTLTYQHLPAASFPTAPPSAPPTALPIPAPAASSSWSCHVHGPLPLSHFSREDLSRHRHRCKRCLGHKMTVYRSRKPLRHMWIKFVQRARVHFNCDAADSLSWDEHGQPLLARLMAGMKEDAQPLQRYKIAWGAGEVQLDLQRVKLMLKQRRKKQVAA
jgi:hypothetical protein